MPKFEDNKKNKKKELLIKYLEESHGVVSDACKMSGISRTAFYEWCKEDPEFKKRVNAIDDIAIDFVESCFYRKISEDLDTTAMIFYLKSKGKKRGWNEKSHVELSGQLGIYEISEEEQEMYRNLSVEQLELMKKLNELKPEQLQSVMKVINNEENK